mgnify:CR=1 FL=1
MAQSGHQKFHEYSAVADSQLIGSLNIGWPNPGEADNVFKTTAFRFADMIAAVLLSFRIREHLQATESAFRMARHEMDVARTIQEQLYPKGAPRLSGFDLGGTATPALTAGGD